MSSPRLVIVHTESSRGWGGQEIRIHTEMLAMRARGHRVELAAPRDATILSRSRADAIPATIFSDHKASYPASMLRLARLFRHTRPQVVNPHSSRDGWIACIAARLARVPCIIRSRHIDVDYPNRFVSRLAFHTLPHHVLTTSRRISEKLVRELRLNPECVSCVPTGIDLARFHPEAAPALRDDPRIPRDRPLLGVVAVLRSWKGHADFLAAARILRQQGSPAHFVIAGDGPGREQLLKSIADPVLRDHATWIGHREDVPNVLASLDIVVLPSYAHEGIPQIVLQAQAAARPVVATAVGGIPEVIEHGRTGLLVPPRDPAALAAALAGLLASPGRAAELSQNALAFARREHGLDLMCRRLEDVYRLHLSAAGSR